MGQETLWICGFTLIFCISLEAWKFPSPPEVCKSLIPPDLQTISPQSSESPFYMKITHTQLHSGANLGITIRSNTSDIKFQGFMIQVRNENGSVPFGQFIKTPEAKWLYCALGKKNMLANREKDEKVLLKTSWICPPRFKGRVHAIATIVRNDNEFWVEHKSPTVIIGEKSGALIKNYYNNSDIVKEWPKKAKKPKTLADLYSVEYC